MTPRPVFQMEVGGRRITLGVRTLVMGVLNVTPDSFSDGGRFFTPRRAIRHGLELARKGADWIDVGGESSRPGSQPVEAEEELRRVLPVIRGLRREVPDVPISIDTTKAIVAERALEAGANILNDISGLRFDPRLGDVARRARVPLILMHSRGKPEYMQRAPFARDIWRSLFSGVEISLRRALDSGLSRSQLIFDPGLGFGKSRRQNYEILAALPRLQPFFLPLLIGASRKSFVKAIVAGEGLTPLPSPNLDANQELGEMGRDEQSPHGQNDPAPAPLALSTGDAAVVTASILGGAHIVRVHDPESVLPAVRIADALTAALR